VGTNSHNYLIDHFSSSSIIFEEDDHFSKLIQPRSALITIYADILVVFWLEFDFTFSSSWLYAQNFSRLNFTLF